MAKVFISYSHDDEDWKDRVVRQLDVLAEEGLSVWQDRQIAGGTTGCRLSRRPLPNATWPCCWSPPPFSLNAALTWFGVSYETSMAPEDKGRALAQAVTAAPTLLVMDGVEPLQHPPGPLASRLRAPGLAALLRHLAGARQAGLCLLGFFDHPARAASLEALRPWAPSTTTPRIVFSPLWPRAPASS